MRGRHSPEFHQNLKQSEASSAGLLPAGPKTNTASQQGGGGAGGVGVASSSPVGGSTLTVTSHTAKLPRLPKTFTSDGAKFRQLLSWLSEDENNQTYTSVSGALVDQPALLETWALWQAEKGGGMLLAE